jgi:hypothetical protein
MMTQPPTMSTETELIKLRQDVWDALGILGDDLDGDPTPAAVVGDLGEWLKDFARRVREELDEPTEGGK